MDLFSKISIKNKLILIIILTSIITISIGFTIITLFENQIYKNELVYENKINAQLLSEFCKAPLTFRDSLVALDVIEKVKTLPFIKSVCIYDEFDDIFVNFHKMSGISLPDSVPGNFVDSFEKGKYSLFYPIKHNGIKIGTIYIESATALLEEKIKRHIVVTLFLIIGLIVLSYFIALKLQAVISQPIKELTAITQNITIKADYSIRVQKKGNDEITMLHNSFNDMLIQLHNRENERDEAERLLRESELKIKEINVELEERVRRRTSQLLVSNKELEAFAYSVSHDLRTPLRSVDGFSQILLEEYRDCIDEQGRDYLERIRKGAQRMSQLIDDLLKLSKVSRSDIRVKKIDVSSISNEIINELVASESNRKIKFTVQEKMYVKADERLIRIVMENLIENAWKFTSKLPLTRINIGMNREEGKDIVFVKDNGAGFDMKYANKLFGAFQRLHSTQEFSGNGIGLATVLRIVNKHGGKVWAEGQIDKGATFYFTIP